MKPDEIFETLPSHCRRLVEEIEAASGLEVKVLSGQEFRDSYQGPVFGGALPNKPEAVSSPDHDLVLYPGEELSLTHDDYHHELLHLHIAHVRGQPEIRAVEPERDGQMAGMLNNELDHLVIHPEQCEASETFKDTWIKTIRSFWQGFPQIRDALGQPVDPDSTALNATTRYFKTRRIAPKTMIDYTRQRLRVAGLLTATHQVCKEMDDVWPDKVGLLRICAGVLNVPSERFCLYRIDHASRAWDVGVA